MGFFFNFLSSRSRPYVRLVLALLFAISVGVLPLTAQWSPLNPVQSIQKNSDGLTVFLERGALRFQVCADSMVRVLYSPGREFPQVTEYALAENARIDDRAVMCCSGSVVADSWLFVRPDQGHRTSPFFRTTLRLHTIAEAQERYNEFAAIEFDKVHSAPRGGWIGEDGQMHEHPAPKNPYRTKVLT